MMVEEQSTAIEPASYPAPSQAADQAAPPNPIHLVRDRLHNRWKWVFLFGTVLAVVLAGVAFRLAPVKYKSVGYVQVEDRLQPLVQETIETSEVDNFTAFVSSRATLMLSDRVLEAVVRAIRTGRPPEVTSTQVGRNPANELALLAKNLEGLDDSQVVAFLRENLTAAVPRFSSFIELSCESKDPKIPAAAVNIVLDFFMQIYGPNAEFEHSEQMSKIRALATQSRNRLERFEEERAAILRDAGISGSEVGAAQASLQSRIASRRTQLDAVEQQERRIEKRYRDQLRARGDASADSAELVIPDSAVIEPTPLELEAIDPTLAPQRRALVEAETSLMLVRRTHKEEHKTIRESVDEIARRKAFLEAARLNAIETWRGSATEADTTTYGALVRQRKQLTDELAQLSAEGSRTYEVELRVGRIDRDIASERADLNVLAERLRELDREADIIRRGRIAVVEAASERGAPESDRRVPFAAIGGVAGFGLVFGLFFVVGSIDPRAFRASQLQGDQKMGRWLGVVPDMTGADKDPELRELALNCIHRIRNKVEQQRPDAGCFAIMVTSPFQGDGKTTVAMALGTSYAEAGHRTILVDCDFIGRSLSYQFGHLSKRGVSEVLRKGALGDEIIEIERNLSLLPVGADATFSGSHLQIGALRRLVRQLREKYDVVIFDSGPVTASVEAIPIASSCDAALLSIRRGRSRNRIPESIRELVDAGANYLGLVLNYAAEDECRKFGSISRMSAEVAKALTGSGPESAAPVHPLHGLRAAGRGDGPSSTERS